MRNSIYIKVLSLTISILFAVTNINYALPVDWPALRQLSTGISPAGVHVPLLTHEITSKLSNSGKSLAPAETKPAASLNVTLEQLLGSMSLKEAATEANLILKSNGRYLYSGDYYIAVSRTTKEYGLIKDEPSLIGEGAIVGLGDSDAGLSFLGTDKLKNRIYLPFYLGGDPGNSNIIEVKERQIAGAKAVLGLVARALEGKFTYGIFYGELKQLVKGVMIPSGINLKDTFKIDTVYADKDKTLTLPEGGKPDDEMTDYVCRILIKGSRFVILSSNAPEEIIENFATVVKSRLTEIYGQDTSALNKALSGLEIYYNNSLGCLDYDTVKNEFRVKYEIKDTIPDNAKAMILKMYIKVLLEYLKDAGSKTVNGTPVIKNKRVIGKLERIYKKLNREEVNRIMALTEPLEICNAFRRLVEPYKDILGTSKGNIYIRTWADAFVTTETAKAASYLQGLFPKWAQERIKNMLSEISMADNEIFHSNLDSARELFRQGESLWLKAKNSPEAYEVENSAKEAVRKFEQARDILNILPIKDVNARRLLQLLIGDKPQERIGGHIGRSRKTIKESKIRAILCREDGRIDESAAVPSNQYLHADPTGLIHPTLSLFIFTPEGDVVFQRRAPDKVAFPNMLTLAVCGHLDRKDDGKIKDIFTALEDEVSGEAGILNICSKPVSRIGDPAKIKDSTIYDQRIELIAYEFVATSKEEADALESISREINEREKESPAPALERLICNYNDEIWTLTLYTFRWDKKDAIEKEAKRITRQTKVPIGDVNYNREAKALYAYIATEEDMEILRTKKTKHKDEEIARFEVDARSVKEIAKDFQDNPEKYPDTFIPTFTDPVIVEKLADIQKEARSDKLRLAENGLAAEGYIPGRAIQRKPAIGGFDYSYFYYWDSQTGDFALKLHGGRIDADAWFENWYLKNIKPEDIKAVKEGYVS
ncbi:MAG: hypothetical protein ABH843_03450, partial [Candidatus Omnitrophota bacterium]